MLPVSCFNTFFVYSFCKISSLRERKYYIDSIVLTSHPVLIYKIKLVGDIVLLGLLLEEKISLVSFYVCL